MSQEPRAPEAMPLTAPTWLRSAVNTIEGDARLDPLVRKLAGAAAPLASGRRGEVLQGRRLGHALHPLLTDLPLGFWMSANLLDLVGGRGARRSAQRLVGLGLLAVPPTVASGMSDWSTITSTRTRRAGAVHAVGNTVVALCYLRSWRSRRRGQHLRGVAFATVGGALAVGTGYLGGHLAYGRRAGTGERGLGVAEPLGRLDADADADADMPMLDDANGDVLIDLTRASEMMGVPAPQVLAMVDEGLLDPVMTEPALRFREVEVQALRLLGG